MQWLTIFKRENLEAARNFKWVWVPLVFIILGVTDPLSTYYLPEILDSMGGLPEGATVDIPTPPPGEVLIMSLSQFNMLGVLIVVLMSMGTISGERKSGVAELVLVKPVHYHTYISAKWAGTLGIVAVSLFLGLLSSWYYTNLLIGDVAFGQFMQLFLFYGVWLALVVTFSLFFNTLFRSPGMVSFLTLAVVILISMVSNVLSHILTWSPGLMIPHLSTMLAEGSVPGELWAATSISLATIVILLIASTLVFRTKEMA
ncbi:ABC transporter permease [Thalassobacillus sp. CUG 92003]|uniref:ABC transporter permease n=1 Tax=Thalassobacillus sp. CUG 92003 TaxID=2736641 RepID=UPI0015E7BC90|nr:ABC transporter permease subunit [Thalassobacillus sp. CUG 92003]